MTLTIRGATTEGGAKPTKGALAHAEGDATSATGQASHAEGGFTIVSGQYAHGEGSSCQATGESAHAEGNAAQATGSAAHAEGIGSVASGDGSHAGGYYGKPGRKGQFSRGGSLGLWVTSQLTSMLFLAQTTNATPTVLLTDGSNGTTPVLTGSGTSVFTIPVKAMATFRIEAVARRTDAQGEMASFTITGLIGRDATGNARIIGTPVTTGFADSGASTWTLAVSVDTGNATNNYLAITATGQAAKTIAWVAALYATELVTTT